MLGFLAKAIVSGLIIASVAQLSPKLPRLGALILSLPLISIVAMLFVWFPNKNLTLISKMSLDTLILVPLGLVFFVPLALSVKMELGFWSAFFLGIVFASILISLWLWLSPN